ncbi:MAG: hypothetical protein MUE81_13960 [Thermoflexibacter sp.]|nr:hypothetical protein [Thermoflexibacter sp.]
MISVSVGSRYSFFQNVGARPLYRYIENQPLNAQNIVDTVQYGKGEVLKSYGGLEPRLSLRITTGETSSLKFGYNRTR